MVMGEVVVVTTMSLPAGTATIPAGTTEFNLASIGLDIGSSPIVAGQVMSITRNCNNEEGWHNTVQKQRGSLVKHGGCNGEVLRTKVLGVNPDRTFIFEDPLEFDVEDGDTITFGDAETGPNVASEVKNLKATAIEVTEIVLPSPSAAAAVTQDDATSNVRGKSGGGKQAKTTTNTNGDKYGKYGGNEAKGSSVSAAATNNVHGQADGKGTKKSKSGKSAKLSASNLSKSAGLAGLVPRLAVLAGTGFLVVLVATVATKFARNKSGYTTLAEGAEPMEQSKATTEVWASPLL